VTVSEELAAAYSQLKIVASMAYHRDIYDIEYRCREALANIGHVANALDLDYGPWTAPSDLAD
jgi:hypothetical protein